RQLVDGQRTVALQLWHSPAGLPAGCSWPRAPRSFTLCYLSCSNLRRARSSAIFTSGRTNEGGRTMCRWAAYIGEEVFLEDIVTAPCHSLIAHSPCAREAKSPTNGDGFGIAWYADRPEPGVYRDIL